MPHRRRTGVEGRAHPGPQRRLASGDVQPAATGEVVKFQRRGVGQRRGGGHDGDAGTGEDRGELEPVQLPDILHHGHVDLPQTHCVVLVGQVQVLVLQREPGLLNQDGVPEKLPSVGHAEAEDADPERSAVHRAVLRRDHAQALQLRQDRTRMFDEALTHRRQLHPPARALEEPHADLTLQPLNVPAERLSGDEMTTGRPSEMELFGQGDHVPKGSDLHRASTWDTGRGNEVTRPSPARQGEYASARPRSAERGVTAGPPSTRTFLIFEDTGRQTPPRGPTAASGG
jgi:hypothetical protein